MDSRTHFQSRNNNLTKELPLLQEFSSSTEECRRVGSMLFFSVLFKKQQQQRQNPELGKEDKRPHIRLEGEPRANTERKIRDRFN